MKHIQVVGNGKLRRRGMAQQLASPFRAKLSTSLTEKQRSTTLSSPATPTRSVKSSIFSFIADAVASIRGKSKRRKRSDVLPPETPGKHTILALNNYSVQVLALTTALNCEFRRALQEHIAALEVDPFVNISSLVLRLNSCDAAWANEFVELDGPMSIADALKLSHLHFIRHTHVAEDKEAGFRLECVEAILSVMNWTSGMLYVIERM